MNITRDAAHMRSALKSFKQVRLSHVNRTIRGASLPTLATPPAATAVTQHTMATGPPSTELTAEVEALRKQVAALEVRHAHQFCLSATPDSSATVTQW